MSSEKETLDIFGQFLMEHLRDRAMLFYENLEQGNWKGYQRLQAEIALLTPEQKELVRKCVTLSIDDAIHNFLFLLHQTADNYADFHRKEDSIQILVDGQDITGLTDYVHWHLFSTDFEKGWLDKYSQYENFVGTE